MPETNKTGISPVPDPTILTTQQSDKGLLALRELFEAELETLKSEIKCTNDYISLRRTDIQNSINNLKDFHDEKFMSVERRFTDSKTTLDVVLTAQKEAVSKSEAAFTKQLDEIGKRMDTLFRAMDEKASDLKERITQIESFAKGQTGGISSIGAIVLGIIAGLAALVSVFNAVRITIGTG